LASRKLGSHPLANVTFPDDDKKQQFADTIKLGEPLVDDTIGFMDGVSFSTKCTDERLTHNAIYSGCVTIITNIFAYEPNGKVFCCDLNFPGSWGDGAVIA
jgi:hypothetical protein